MEGNERSNEKGEGSGGAMHVTRVMTEEQMELLRRQISVYATICEQLVEMHKSFTTRQDPLSGMRSGSIYSDPLMTPGGHRMTGRQRWTPTIGQLQILEKMFEQDNGAPSKQKIKQIASELSQHGQISETNVYNWFQNRRARSKRKQTAASSNTESEFEAEAESSDEKRTKLEKMYSYENEPPRIENASSQSREITSEVHGKNPELNKMQSVDPSVDSSKSSESPALMSLNENALSSSNMNQPPDGKDGHSGEHYYFSARRGIT